MSADEKIIKIEKLSFSYDDKKDVLDKVDLTVERGSFVSILGPNGSGKSTLVKVLSKVLKGYEGEIIIDGKNIKRMKAKDVAKIVAVVPQFTEPGFDFSVEEMVYMGRHPHISRFGRETLDDKRIVEEVIERTRLSSFLDKRFRELSGGERQRVVIAQALVQDTPLILLDEPTSHLDINFQIELMELISRLNKQSSKTILGVFHDINLAIHYSDKIALLKDGRIFGYGKVSEVIDKEKIKKVFGSDVHVGKNPFTGKLYISPAFYVEREEYIGSKEIRIHVIGGGGAASPILNALSRFGYYVSCGVVNTLDTDMNTSEELGISYVSEAPFSPISLYSQNKNMSFIKDSDIVVLPEIEIGHGNFSNIVSVKEALEMGKKVFLMQQEGFSDKDHTEGKALRLIEGLKQEGAVIFSTIDELAKHISHEYEKIRK